MPATQRVSVTISASVRGVALPVLHPCACGSTSTCTEVHNWEDGIQQVDIECSDCGAFVSGCPSLADAHTSWNDFAREQRERRAAEQDAAAAELLEQYADELRASCTIPGAGTWDAEREAERLVHNRCVEIATALRRRTEGR